MPKNKPQPYLMCYDISDPKRLARIHRLAIENGQALQYSVFLVIKTEEDMDTFIQELQREMNEKEDDIRIYPLDNRTTITTLGQAIYPEGIYLIDNQVHIDFAPP